MKCLKRNSYILRLDSLLYDIHLNNEKVRTKENFAHYLRNNYVVNVRNIFKKRRFYCCDLKSTLKNRNSTMRDVNELNEIDVNKSS